MVAAGFSLRKLKLAATFKTTMDRAASKFQKEDSLPRQLLEGVMVSGAHPTFFRLPQS
jgi:hypothetical protein